MRLHFAFVSAVLCVAGVAASAQTVYRCGNSYSERPCPNGVALDVADPRTPAQRAEAAAAAARDTQTANALEKSRLAEEARVEAARTREAKSAAIAKLAAEKKAQREADANRIPVYPGTYSPPYYQPNPYPVKKVVKKPPPKRPDDNRPQKPKP